MIIDDYAHHPTVIEDARRYPRAVSQQNLRLFFNPICFADEALLQEFAESPVSAQNVGIMRLIHRPEVSGQDAAELVAETKFHHANVTYLGDGATEEVSG